MGKKAKIGKQRKDKYYQLAKETGYRSRAAFKLIQLNRKFGFLQKARVCIDLCAAPGGWMQVAHQNMPLSSIVIGVDLFPIKTVQGCISLTEDITTEKCRTAISKEIKTWKADVVLNDGAPNVGLNWLHDAYQQATLTLSALKLATNFLKEGGWFVTKVFRSKDYHPLLWVFKQLFKKVHATKPQASRNESSEIFVVCQHYIAPDVIDPKFLDPKYVFDEFEMESKKKFNILHPEKQKKAKAEGYQENDYTQHVQVPVSEFLSKEDPVDLLRGCAEIVIDDEAAKSHPRTTPEIIECCKDIKVLGRKDLKLLLSWLKAVKSSRPEEKLAEVPVEPQEPEQSEDEKEENEVDAKILELQDEEKRDSKRKRKLLNKQRQKLSERMNLKMVLKGDVGPVLESDDMFKLQDIKNVNQLKKMTDQLPEVTAVSDEESGDETKLKPKYMKYNTEDSHLHSSGTYYKDSDSEIEMESDSGSDDDKASLGFSDSDGEDKTKKLTKLNTKKNSKTPKVLNKGHPLLNDLDDRDEKTVRSRRAENWFNKDSFKEFDEDEDEDMDLDKLAHTYKKKGKKILDTAAVKGAVVPTKRQNKVKSVDSGVDSDDTDDNTSDSDYEVEKKINPSGKKVGKKGAAVSEDTFDVVPQDPELKRLKKSLVMDEEALSLGTMLATSRKFKRDLIDDSWNRYMFVDKHLPDWFVEDEAKNMKKPVVVPEEYADEYKKRVQEINVRPIKKVVEAKARKKKRMVKKMERAKKKIESVMENADMSEREKARQVKQLYKKANTERKKEVTYVVARKHTTSKRMKKPAGVKGRYRVVDPRQKKDLRATKAQDKKNNKFKRPASKKGNKKANKAK